MRAKRSRPCLTLVFRVNDTNADLAGHMKIKAASNRNGTETSVTTVCSKRRISKPTEHFEIWSGPPERVELPAIEANEGRLVVHGARLGGLDAAAKRALLAQVAAFLGLDS